ncbi:MAG: hypothetical protein D4R83_03280 [Streptomycetaceae bacterium]|nr:MAG: hypothetical protein D4R83_03280 [Streptomycetaceae bacterium]
MDIRFSQSARRHRIGKQRALFVITTNTPTEFPFDGIDPVRFHWEGLDDRGLELEIVGVHTPTGILIIHVMPTSLRRRKS